MSDRLKISNHKGVALKARQPIRFSPGKPKSGGIFRAVEKTKLINSSHDKYSKIFLHFIGICTSVFLLFTLTIIIKSALFEKVYKPRVIDLSNEQTTSEIMRVVLRGGYHALAAGYMQEAQDEFTIYLKKFPKHFKGNLGMTMVLISRCELDRNYCKRAQEYYDYTSSIMKASNCRIYGPKMKNLSDRLERLPY